MGGQILLSVRAKDVHQPTVMEALRRAKYEFPGRQRLCASENWGFTKLRRDQCIALKALGQLVKNGVDTKVASLKGPLGPNELQKLRCLCSATAPRSRFRHTRDK